MVSEILLVAGLAAFLAGFAGLMYDLKDMLGGWLNLLPQSWVGWSMAAGVALLWVAAWLGAPTDGTT